MTRWAASCLFLFAIFGCNKLLPHLAGTKPIVDSDYQFRLSSPGPDWRLLAEKEIQRISPDSVAGAAEFGHGVADRHGTVTVEAYSEDKLREFASLLIDNMQLENKKTVSMVDLEFEKRPAIRYHVTGTVNGVELRYVNVVFFNQGHAYQVTAWGIAGQVDEKGLQAFSDAFHLTEGPVRDRSSIRKVEDERGVGYWVKGGVFRSAAAGLTLHPGDGWRLSIGGELDRMNGSAEVGLVHTSPEAYMILIPNQPGEVSREDYAKSRLKNNATVMGLDEVAGLPGPVEVDGQKVEFTRYQNKKESLEYLMGVLFHGDTAYLVMTWYKAEFSAQGQVLLQTGLGGLHFLDEPARLALGRELLALPDVQAAVGPTYALRRGVYRDFEQGLSWRKPPGALRIFVGPQAHKHNPDATLFFIDLGTGLYGLLIADNTKLDGAAYHQAVTQRAAKGPRSSASPVQVGKLPGLVTVTEKNRGGTLLIEHMVTAVDAGHAYQVMLWGRPAAMKNVAARLQAVLSGFSFGALTPMTWEGEALTDQRLGFSFHPPAELGADFHHTDITPKELRPLGTIVEWKNEHYSIALISLHAAERAQDEDWFLEQIHQLMPGRSSLLSSTNMSPDRLGGEPARRVSMKQLGQLQGELLMLKRDGTFYCLAVDKGSDSLAPSAMDAMKASFRFVD